VSYTSSAERIFSIFRMDGITTGEAAVLMSYCNHTDRKGYAYVTMRLIADEAHMTVRAARDNKRRLEAKSLIRSLERRHAKNGARITDAVRVNDAAIRSMQRGPRDYGQTLAEEILFDPEDAGEQDAEPQEESAGAPEQSAGGEEESAGAVGEESAPLNHSALPLLSSGASARTPEPSPDPNERDDQTPEREPATPQDTPSRQAEETSRHAEAVADAWCERITEHTGSRPHPQARTTVRAEAITLLTAGDSADYLIAAARNMADTDTGFRRLSIHLAHYTPPRTRTHEECPDHPGRIKGRCVECALAVPV
jgi:hypothetical protein